MSNDVKRTDLRFRGFDPEPIGASAVPARATLLACLGALGVLLTQLPGPAAAWAALTGDPRLRSVGDPLAAMQAILLTTAGLLAWLLAGWAVLVLGIGLLARLPGRPGRRARRLLPRIAPAAVGRLVLAAVGASLIAGTAACAAPDAGAGSPVSTPASDLASGPTSGATGPTDTFSINWPDPTPTPTPTPAPAPTGSVGTSSAPANTTTTTPATPTPATPTPEPAAPPVVPGTAPTTSAMAPSEPTTSPSPATTAAPARASTSTSTPTAAAATATPGAPEPAGPGDGPSTQDPGPAPTPSSAVAPAVRIVTVQPGDSLWRIAAHSLGPDASDADIDNAWRAWYFNNRAVIGDDPDSIVPGQPLVAPDSGQVQP